MPFVDTDAEYRAGRAQDFLEPEHVEKVVAAFERFEDVPSFAAVAPAEAPAAEDFNLNIRRYADDAPPPATRPEPGSSAGSEPFGSAHRPDARGDPLGCVQ